MSNVAFDIDNTLYKVIDEGPIDVHFPGGPHRFVQGIDFDLMQVLLWHLKNGDSVYIWSAGGIEYAENWANRFLPLHPDVHVIEKSKKHKEQMDVCYDDQEVDLAKANILVKRGENYGEVIYK